MSNFNYTFIYELINEHGAKVTLPAIILLLYFLGMVSVFYVCEDEKIRKLIILFATIFAIIFEVVIFVVCFK